MCLFRGRIVGRIRNHSRSMTFSLFLLQGEPNSGSRMLSSALDLRADSGQPEEVVGGGDQQHLLADLPAPHMTAPPQTADGLGPAEDLLHTFPDSLGQLIRLRSLSPAGSAPGLRSRIASPDRSLDHQRDQGHDSQLCFRLIEEGPGPISPVARQCPGLQPVPAPRTAGEQQRLLTFRRQCRIRNRKVHHQSVPILHDHVGPVSQKRLVALLGKSGAFRRRMPAYLARYSGIRRVEYYSAACKNSGTIPHVPKTSRRDADDARRRR